MNGWWVPCASHPYLLAHPGPACHPYFPLTPAPSPIHPAPFLMGLHSSVALALEPSVQERLVVVDLDRWGRKGARAGKPQCRSSL